MAMTLPRYIESLRTSIQRGDGTLIADLLSIHDRHAKDLKLSFFNWDPDIKGTFAPAWADMFSLHVRCLQNLYRRNFEEAFKHQYSLVQSFIKIFQTMKDENWALPIMFSICLDLRKIADNADAHLNKQEKPHELLEKAAELLMSCFRICVADNRASQEDTKRWGILNLTNQLFKIYFKVNKLHLLKPLIRVIESSNLKDEYPISERVTYSYFLGQQLMFQKKFKQAAENLSFAFKYCGSESIKNKRLILIFLIPVKMLLGIMPRMEILQKYNLMEFAEIVHAVKEGNLERFGRALNVDEAFFLKWGIRLVVEKLSIIIQRNLFKKVYLLLNNHIINVEVFRSALNFKKEYEDDEEIETDEVLCILSNLICENLIKGYISYEHQKVVLSKQNAFPALPAIESVPEQEKS